MSVTEYGVSEEVSRESVREGAMRAISRCSTEALSKAANDAVSVSYAEGALAVDMRGSHTVTFALSVEVYNICSLRCPNVFSVRLCSSVVCRSVFCEDCESARQSVPQTQCSAERESAAQLVFANSVRVFALTAREKASLQALLLPVSERHVSEEV